MRRKRTEGYCLVTTPNGTSWHLPRDQYARVRHAWLHGVRFIDVVGFHGDTGTIRLTDVDSVLDLPPESIMSEIEERRADESDDSLAGGAV